MLPRFRLGDKPVFIVRKKSALVDEFVKMVLSRAIESNIQPSVLGAGQVGRGKRE